MHKQRKIILLFVSLGILAHFLPWFNRPFSGGMDGLDSGGWYTYGLFTLAISILTYGDLKKNLSKTGLIGILVASLVAGIIVVLQMVNANDIINQPGLVDDFGNKIGSGFSFAIGIYLELIAAILSTFTTTYVISRKT